MASMVLAGAGASWLWQRLGTARASVVLDDRERLGDLLDASAASTVEPRARPAFGEPGFPAPLVRTALTSETIAGLFPVSTDGFYVIDEPVYYRLASNLRLPVRFPEHPRRGWIVRTNSLGMREDREPVEGKPDLRILFAGASNVAGACANSESAVNVLEALLAEHHPERSVECLNAGLGCSNFYNYTPVLDRYRGLDPDVFVLIAHGGTDFTNALPLWRHFNGLGGWPPGQFSPGPLGGAHNPFVSQLLGVELGMVAHLLGFPEDLDTAVELACAAVVELEAICAVDEIRLVCVYLPPPLAGQPAHLARERNEALGLLGSGDSSPELSHRIADRWLAFLRERGIECLDLRPAWRASAERYYWRSDPHLNLEGQRAVAQALLPLFVPEGAEEQ